MFMRQRRSNGPLRRQEYSRSDFANQPLKITLAAFLKVEGHLTPVFPAEAQTR